ncbi:MAG TPA: translation elongation factor Ts [bacterium]|nr:translation elongation factor Ts [bacterium]HPP01168.1 translation elongation factor Ts [bacterium]HXK93424.1 translation elongation factor Ts [bacterium]
MVTISASQVKELREKTGAGMMDCKKALTENNGDLEKAIKYLREKGIADASKRSGRVTKEGVVYSYIHPGHKIGVLVEINCETDFVARNEVFQSFAKDIAMHIAASSPLCVSRDEVAPALVEAEREVLRNQARESGKPEQVWDKIVEGRIEKFYAQVCLLEQPFIKDMNITVEDYLKETIGKIGENIVIRRFSRYQLGEELDSKSGK